VLSTSIQKVQETLSCKVLRLSIQKVQETLRCKGAEALDSKIVRNTKLYECWDPRFKKFKKH